MAPYAKTTGLPIWQAAPASANMAGIANLVPNYLPFWQQQILCHKKSFFLSFFFLALTILHCIIRETKGKTMNIFTTDELVTILACFAHRKMEIESLKNNQYVTPEYLTLLEKDLVNMESIQSKLFPTK